MGKDLYDIGELPPLGDVPAQMHAQLVRPDRYGDPEKAIQDEVIDVPELGPNDALVLVMAAGVNFNNVWAARGVPVDVTKTQARWGEPTDFHIVGSDASGVVWAVGDQVSNVQVGDRVVVHAGQWDLDDPHVKAGKDPGLAASFRVWGFDTCWGSFAQFTKVQAHQCLPKADYLTWEEARPPPSPGRPPTACSSAGLRTPWNKATSCWSGAAPAASAPSACSWSPTPAGARLPSSGTMKGRVGEIARRGRLRQPQSSSTGAAARRGRRPSEKDWSAPPRTSARLSGSAGRDGSPRIVFEHPGQDTIPTSIFTCERGGMVVICAGTTGYNGDVDLRYSGTRQKRFQGSHFANDEQCRRRPTTWSSRARSRPRACRAPSPSTRPALSHQLMGDGGLPEGNVSVLINAPTEGLTDLP